MKTVELPLEIIHDKESYMIMTDGETKGWVTKSLVKNYDPDWEEGQTVEAEIPEWLALETGWV